MKHLVTMPKTMFIKEHKKLIKLLDKGNRKALKKEAKSQSKELKKVINQSVY